MSSSTTEALSSCSLPLRSQSSSSIVDSSTAPAHSEAASGEIYIDTRNEAGSDPPVSNQCSASSRKRKNYGPSDMIKVFVPVSICMLLVVSCTRNIEIYKGDIIIKTLYVVYHEPEAETSTKIWHSLVNAGVFLLIVAIATFGIVALFYFKFYRCLNFFVMFATFMLITLVSLTQYYEILRAINYPLSLPIVLFFHGNLATVELMSIFWKGPMKAQQGTLILMAAMVTLTIMRVFPKWTSWAVLIVLGFWDLFAVLSPCGPLKLLVETAEERGEDLMPAIIYTGSATLPKTDLTQSSVESEPNEQRSSRRSRSRGVNSLRAFSMKSSESDDSRNIRLGLGDFIFYSLLVGNASVLADWTTTLSCYVAIVMGLGFTLMLLVVFQKALPALPISIAFGAITFFTSKFVSSKFVEEIYRKRVFL